jgi:recombination protein RecA
VLGDQGLSFEVGLLELGVQAGLISRSGGWYACGETRLGQGRSQARRALAAHPELAGELEAPLRTQLGLRPAEPAAAAS